MRRLIGNVETSPGVVAIEPEDPLFGTEVTEEQVSAAIDDLQTRAARAGRIVSAEELEHARLLLDLARVERQMQRARQAGEGGVHNLAWQKQEIRKALGEAAARISMRGEER